MRLAASSLSSLLVMVLALAVLSGCGEKPAVAKNPKFVPAEDQEDGDKRDEKKADPPPKRVEGDPNEEGPPLPEKPAKPVKPVAQKPMEVDDQFPFPQKWSLEEVFEGKDFFPKDGEWLNTSGPLKLKDLKGKFVILDFWTYCCINCMHILPELKKLEHKYPNELVVIGVHSAKFDGEKDTQNIKDAILRYEIEHPVVNDPEHYLWSMIGIRSWPTVVLIDPEGNLVALKSGEFEADLFAEVLDRAIPYYEKKGTLSHQPLRFEQAAESAAKTPLRYPGKILADEAGKRLFISDSNHNRIVISSLDGKLIDVIGSGAIGKADGAYDKATFDHPQGCFLQGETLYVADTENHLLRKVDLKEKTVKTIAGTGQQARAPLPGMGPILKQLEANPGEEPTLPKRWYDKPLETALNSPWALWIHDKDLYIAMAGPHQIWRMPLDESEIGVYAGNGREDIVDGPLAPEGLDALRHSLGFSSFAQPSGLSGDDEWLYVADSEGSSIRAVPFDPTKNVRTVVGTQDEEGGRLFKFGDADGLPGQALFQHPLDVLYHDGTIYVADTYNNKIRTVNAKTGETKTLVGTGDAGKNDETGTFDEPTGLAYAAGKLYVADTNNSLVRVVDIESKKVSTLTIEGLAPPKLATNDKRPDFAGAVIVKSDEALALKPEDGKVTLNIELILPEGWKINPLAPAVYYVDETGDAKLIDEAALGKKSLEKPSATFAVTLPVKPGETSVSISMNYYYCQDETESGLCKIGSVVFQQPLKISDDAKQTSAKLAHVVKDFAP
jgi:sugar lactone lactonase YvrE